MGSTKTFIRSAAFILTSLLLTQATVADRSKWANHNDNNHSYYQPNRQNQYNPISIDIIDEQGRRYSKHQQNNRHKTHRAYLEAKKGQRYKLRVRNRTNKRIAVVIAVDGRNIISGKKSNLRNNERMYVLGPYKSATYNGWRTGQNKINRFYFTSAGDSYAGAWGDHSAMGVIAAAVYEEKHQYPQYQQDHSNRSHRSNSMAPQAKRSSPAAEAGTGYGREEYSASVRVKFRPKSAIAGKYFYKYEWRETLCNHGVIQCSPPTYYQPENRFWPYDQQGRGAYAPPPPRYNWK